MINQAIGQYISPSTMKIILSNPTLKDGKYEKIVVQKAEENYLVEKYTKTQVFHEKITYEKILEFFNQALSEDFKQCNSWDEKFEYMIRVTIN